MHIYGDHYDSMDYTLPCTAQVERSIVLVVHAAARRNGLVFGSFGSLLSWSFELRFDGDVLGCNRNCRYFASDQFFRIRKISDVGMGGICL